MFGHCQEHNKLMTDVSEIKEGVNQIRQSLQGDLSDNKSVGLITDVYNLKKQFKGAAKFLWLLASAIVVVVVKMVLTGFSIWP